MKKIIIISVLLIATIVIFVIKEKADVLSLPEEMAIISTSGNTGIPKKPLNAKAKVVAYIASKFSLRLLESYEHYRAKYPNIEFRYYIHASEKQKIIDYLKAHSIKSPVYYDKNNDFKKQNLRIPDYVNFIGFIVDDDNRIIKMTNPTIQNFEQLLKKYN